jgi:lysine 2,3-aminomutase
MPKNLPYDARRPAREATSFKNDSEEDGSVAMTTPRTAVPPRAHAGDQPYRYPPARDFVEPDWRRIPAYRDVTEDEWRSARWQRQHTVKNLDQLRKTLEELLPEDLAKSIDRDQRERATMSMLVPPQMINTMDVSNLWDDPIRHYMIPAYRDRHPVWPSHPMAQRDSLHEADMWAVEGLTHRYPTKVLAELLSTCPQYCGHCTRMDLIGNNVPQVLKHRFEMKQRDRHEAMLEYLRNTPSVRDVVVSGGDVANLSISHLEWFVGALLDIENIRDIRLATKGLMGLPQHFLQDDVLAGMDRIAKKALERDVDVAIHVHVNHANSLTPLVATAVKKLHAMGFRDIRNQGVLMRGVNDSQQALLDLCFALLDDTKVMPYYFYMCDMIPNSEHWRLPVHTAQELQHSIMGYLPGFATPRIVCDVPFVGKRWVHQVEEYDRTRGISHWTKNYRTGIEYDDPEALTRRYEYYDPIDTLPEAGQRYWSERARTAEASA